MTSPNARQILSDAMRPPPCNVRIPHGHVDPMCLNVSAGHCDYVCNTGFEPSKHGKGLVCRNGTWDRPTDHLCAISSTVIGFSVLGGVLFAILIGLIVVVRCFCKRRKNRRPHSAATRGSLGNDHLTYTTSNHRKVTKLGSISSEIFGLKIKPPSHEITTKDVEKDPGPVLEVTRL
ncbi:hypothetical protein ScPMuIL_018373 [Solemya velum]